MRCVTNAVEVVRVSNSITYNFYCIFGSINQSTAVDREDEPPGEVTQLGELTLTSTAFDHGEQIPEQYGYREENANPPVEGGNVVARTQLDWTYQA